MTIVHKGSRLAVNLAPFIGSSSRSKDRVPCRALAVADNRVLVRVDPPFRPLDLWIDMDWVEDIQEVADTASPSQSRPVVERLFS